MSSHHIVREKQEPALLIMDLDAIGNEYLGQLLEWSPTVIVAEHIFEKADSMGIKIDALVHSNPAYPAQEHTHIILSESDPAGDALKYLISEKYPAVNIISREFKVKDYALFIQKIDLVIFSGDKKIFPVRPGFSKWKAA